MPGSITFNNVSFRWPDGTPVVRNIDFAVGPGRTALVGPNGIGKSTLLRLIVGELKPASGKVSVNGVVGYLAQTLPMAGHLTVAAILGIARVRSALASIERGTGGVDDFDTVEDDWDIEERARATLDRVGLGRIHFDRTVSSLSGGEIVTLGHAAELLKDPDVLVLDEPTNNLDITARGRLYEVVSGFTGCLLVVSHDRSLLELVDQVAELSHKGVSVYGGMWNEYEEAVAREQKAAQQALNTSKQNLLRQRRDARDALQRSSRRAAYVRRNQSSFNLPKTVAGARKRQAQVSAARSAALQSQREKAAERQMKIAKERLRDESVAGISLPETEVARLRHVLVFQGANISLDEEGPIFGQAGIDLTIRGPERIALVGDNGSGKTTFLRLASGLVSPDEGHVERRVAGVGWLPQRLDILDDDMSVLENLRRFAPNATANELRHHLAQLLFRGERAELRAADLSGGERLRVVLACLLFAQPAPQLLLLDEPTNNLDLATVRELQAALGAYRGALAVASHDLSFLREIGTTRWLWFRKHTGPIEVDPPEA